MLGTAAVASVYAAGYVSTQSSIDDLAARLDVPGTVAGKGTGGTPSKAGPPMAGAQAPTTSTTSGSVTYVDGTYTGRGSSRHGDIAVAVVIEGGAIVSAAVTDCGTRYPCSDVNPLVSEVLTSGTVPVHNVSGATDSSRAYRAAVAQALQKALGGV